MNENETTKKEVAVSTPSKDPGMKRNAHQIRNHFCRECRWYDTSSERKFHRKVGKKDEKGKRSEIVEIRAICVNPKAASYHHLVMVDNRKRQCEVWEKGTCAPPKIP
jgi:hypothetical protein